MPRAFTDAERTRIRRLLLDAGRAAMAAGGLRRVPVERICASAGISKGAFYLFFPSKESLVIELLLEAERELRAALLARAADTPPARRLHAVLRLLFDAGTSHPLLRVLGDPEELAWLVRALPEGHFEAARADDDAFFAGLLARLRADGLVGEVDPVAFAGLGAAALAIAQQRALVGEDRYEAVVDLLVEGLVARLGAGATTPERRTTP